MRRSVAGQPQITAPLARWATAHHGVIGLGELRQLGITDQAIRTLVAKDLLIRLHRGVYAVGHAHLSAHGRWRAAVLACGAEALLSHTAALALFDCARIPSGPVDVVAPTLHRVPGVRCHVARRCDALGARTVEAIPVVSVERAVLDRAPSLTRPRLVTLLENVQRRGLFDMGAFEAMLAACNGHRGVGLLRDALLVLGDEPPAVRSMLEARMLELIREAGLPEPSVNVIVAGELVDLRWPDRGVVVEIDSWRYHRSRRSFEADRRRRNAITLTGATFLSFTDRRIDREPQAVIAELRSALARG